MTNTNLLDVTQRILLQKTKKDYLEFTPQFLTFKVSYTKVPVKLSTDNHSKHNNEQFVGCLIKKANIKDFTGILTKPLIF